MSDSMLKSIEAKLRTTNKGRIFFINDFASLGSEDSVRQSLLRLTRKKTIMRLAKGIYYYPKKDELLGVILPSSDQIAQAIAKRDKARIIPTGSYALFKLGLSTQIPMNVVYLTDGSARKIQVGKQKITFKKTSPKNLAIKHKLSSLIIQGLKELGEQEVDEKIKGQLKEVIYKSGEQSKVQESMLLAPVWIQKVVSKIISDTYNE
jgi:hypothetical protein